MITYLDQQGGAPQKITLEDAAAIKILGDAVWIDLFSPSKAEEKLIEQCIGCSIPTRDEMTEIEFSSRLYKENDTLFMTAIMLAQSDSLRPKIDPVTFILTQKQLITIRYVESQPFKMFAAQVKKLACTNRDAITVLISLLDTAIDRLADILEVVGSRLDDCSKAIFGPEDINAKSDYHHIMQQIGINADLNTKARESLITFNRLLSFFGQTAHIRIDGEGQSKLMSVSTDVTSLSDYANFISMKVNFLLDATLGMINIEQNNIIKIFSVVAVIFLPPTLVASIYGMNFHIMPELSWRYGYILALGMIVTAAWLPYKYFKYRKWL